MRERVVKQSFRASGPWSVIALFFALLGCACQPLVLHAAQTNGLVAAYGFNEGTGNLAVDASATGNDGNVIDDLREAREA